MKKREVMLITEARAIALKAIDDAARAFEWRAGAIGCEYIAEAMECEREAKRFRQAAALIRAEWSNE